MWCTISPTDPRSFAASFGVVPVAQTQVIDDDDDDASSATATPTRTSSSSSNLLLTREQIQSGRRIRVSICSTTTSQPKSATVLLGDTVLMLKEKVAQLFNVPVESQQLVFGSSILQDASTLLDAGLFMGCTVHLVSSIGTTPIRPEEFDAMLPAGFTGRFVSLESCGKCPWYYAASYVTRLS